jgi:hypothetical protein
MERVKPQARKVDTNFSNRRRYFARLPAGIQRRHRGLLDRSKLPAVAVVFDVGKCLDDLCIPADPSNPPANHIETFAERMNFHPNVTRFRDLKEAQRLPLESQQHVSGILDDDELVAFGKRDHLLIEVPGGYLACGAVGIVQHQHFDARPKIGRHLGEIRIEVILFQQRQTKDTASVIPSVRPCNGIARDCHQRDVARIDEAGRQHGKRRLAADAVVDLRGGVERDSELSLHESRHRLLEFSDAVVSIASVLRSMNLPLHRLPHHRIGHRIIFADAEVDQPSIRIVGKRLPLGSLDLLKLVDLGPLAILSSPNPFGEKRLEIGILQIKIGTGAGHRSLFRTYQAKGMVQRAVCCTPISTFFNQRSRSPLLATGIAGTLVGFR